MVGRALTASTVAASTALHRLGLAPRLRSRADVRVVLYHGIGDGSAPWMTSLSDEIPMDSFVRQIDYLRARYRIVSLEDATLRLTGVAADGDAPLCCVTFDDGLATVYRRALPFLASQRIPATVFVNTSVIGNGTLLWQHLLSCVIHSHGVARVSAALRRHGFEVSARVRDGRALIAHCQSDFARLSQSRALAAAAAEFGVDAGHVAQSEKPYLEWAQMREMSRQGFVFCSHTANHLPLAALDQHVMRREIDDARLALAGRDEACGRFLSFPFGMETDYGSIAREYALASHYDYVFEVGDGWNPRWRVRRHRRFGRVCLGADVTSTETYAALEMRPLLKGMLNSIRMRRESDGRRETYAT